MWFNHPKKRRNFFRKAQVAPYQARRFRNPFFQSKSKKHTWIFAVIGISVGLTIALSSFFFTAPIFKISAVRIEGTETINPKNIREIVSDYLSARAFLIFQNSNRFLFSEEKVKQKLNKNFSFSELIVQREGKTLAIIVKERITSFLWISSNQSFLLDNNGVVIRAASVEEANAMLSPTVIEGPTEDGTPIPEPTTILIFTDLTNKSVTVGASTLDKNYFEQIKKFHEALRNLGLNLLSFEFNQDVGSWMKAKTQNGFFILFDPKTDIVAQISNLDLVLKTQIKDTSKLEYIDVRFGDHVYYK